MPSLPAPDPKAVLQNVPEADAASPQRSAWDRHACDRHQCPPDHGDRSSTSCASRIAARRSTAGHIADRDPRSEEHTSELQSLMRISYAVFCLKKKKHNKQQIKIKNLKVKHKDRNRTTNKN